MSGDLTIEKMKLNDRLTKLESTLESILPEIRRALDENKKAYEINNKLLTGNGNPKDGLLFKFTLMENRLIETDEERKRRQKHIFLVWVALIPIIVERLWSFFTHKI